MMRITDKKLAELERMDREASDDWTGVYDAFDGVSTLKTGRITLTSDATDARDDVFMACAARNALPSLLAEVRELRAKLARVSGYRDRLASEMRASAHRLAFFRYDTHAHVATELAALAGRGEYDAAIFGKEGA